MSGWEKAGDGCTCSVNPNPFTHYGATEPGDALEPDPECPKHFPTRTIEQEAGAEAEKLYPAKESVDGWPSTRYLTAMANRKGFIQGYIAGASRPVTDAEIEKARVAYVEAWEAERKRIGRGIAPKGTKSRAGMRAALEAIRPTEGNPT